MINFLIFLGLSSFAVLIVVALLGGIFSKRR